MSKLYIEFAFATDALFLLLVVASVVFALKRFAKYTKTIAFQLTYGLIVSLLGASSILWSSQATRGDQRWIVGSLLLLVSLFIFWDAWKKCAQRSSA